MTHQRANLPLLTRFDNSGAHSISIPSNVTALIGLAVADDGIYVTAKDTRSWRHIFGISSDNQVRDFIGGDTVGDNLTNVSVFGAGQNAAARERWPGASAPELAPDGALFIRHSGEISRLAPTTATPYLGLPLGYSVPAADGSMVYEFDQRGKHLRTRHALTGAELYRFEYNPLGQLQSVIDGNGDTISIARSGNQVNLTAPDGQVTRLNLSTAGFVDAATSVASAQTWTMTYNGTNTGLLRSFARPINPPSTFDYNGGVLVTDRNARGGGFDFNSYTWGGRDQRFINMDRIQGGFRRIYKSRQGASNNVGQYYSDGSYAAVSSSGSFASQSLDRHGVTRYSRKERSALFGFTAPFVGTASVTTPAGLGFVREATQSATTNTATPELGLVDLEFTSFSTGKALGTVPRLTTRTYASATRTWTIRSPELRTRSVRIDGQGRPLFSQPSGLAGTSYEYDARGRLRKTTTGSGPTARSYELAYDSFGYVNSITDAEKREITLVNDAVGRTTKMRLPDLREVKFRYDANNNPTGVKPPGRDWHTFGYDSTDNLARYEPPLLPGVSVVNTSYGYDLHPKLPASRAQMLVMSRCYSQTAVLGQRKSTRRLAFTATPIFPASHKPRAHRHKMMAAPPAPPVWPTAMTRSCCLAKPQAVVKAAAALIGNTVISWSQRKLAFVLARKTIPVPLAGIAMALSAQWAT